MYYFRMWKHVFALETLHTHALAVFQPDIKKQIQNNLRKMNKIL